MANAPSKNAPTAPAPVSRSQARVAAAATAAQEPAGPKFYSMDGEDVHVALPDGSKAIVNEPRALPPKFWREAIKQGCATTSQIDPRQLKQPKADPSSDQQQRRNLIEKAIREAFASSPDDQAFADAIVPATGAINMKWLNDRVGFGVERSERDEITRMVEADLDEQESNGKQEADANDLAAAQARIAEANAQAAS